MPFGLSFGLSQWGIVLMLWKTRPQNLPGNPGPFAFAGLDWVGEWISNVRDFIYVRSEDNVFIQRPNKAFHLNDEGVTLMKALLDGQPIEDILAPHANNPQAIQDTGQFLLDLRQMLKEGIDDTYESSAVEKIPFKMGFSKLPVLSEIAVTYKCNAACQFCYAGCNCTTNPVGNDKEMTLDEIKTVLDRIRNEAKVPSVSFTGGEATLRKDLHEMIRYARSIGMRVNLITNGMASTEKVVAKLVDAGLHSVQVSIEGTTAAMHDEITATPGAYKRAVAAVHRYREAGIHVNTNTTITRINRNDALEFPEYTKNTLKLDAFSMNLMIPTGSGALNDKLVVSYTELGPILEKIQAESLRLGVEFKWYSPTPMCMFNPIVHGLGNKGCSACDGLISVGADGQVLPCASYDKPLGNLLNRSFDSIWQTEAAKTYRNKSLAHELCKSCENFHICNGACPLYWRHMGFDELNAVAGMANDRPNRVDDHG